VAQLRTREKKITLRNQPRKEVKNLKNYWISGAPGRAHDLSASLQTHIHRERERERERERDRDHNSS